MESLSQSSEESLWVLLIEEKNQWARAVLIERYMSLARKIAAYLFGGRPDNDVEFDDYLQHAYIGLVEAVDHFKSDTDAVFSTYATYRIRGAVLNGISKATEGREQSAFRARMCRDRTESLSPGTPQAENKKRIFEELVDVAIGLALGFMLEDSGMVFNEHNGGEENTPYTISEFDELKKNISGVIEALPERESVIIRYHYFHQVDFESLGAYMNISKGRVSQLHKRALQMLRQKLASSIEVDRSF